MAKVAGIKNSFNAGELSPLLAGRTDIAKYASGCSEMTNFIPTVQGAAIRRPGTKFVAEVKDSSKRVWLARFQFNFQQSFILEFGDQYIRFYHNHGQLLSGGVPYEISTPYILADLTNSDGSFALSMAQSGDVIYIAHRKYAPRKLSRISNTSWTLTALEITTGPFKQNNTDKTVTVTADSLVMYIGSTFAEYSTTLTASSEIFSASMVGEIFQIELTSDGKIKPWAATKSVALSDLCRNELKYYGVNEVTDAGSDSIYKTGYVSPAHTYGGRFDGDEVSWWYLADQVGVCKITAYTSATKVEATVIRQIMPVTTTTTTQTWAWSKAYWNTTDGYPSHVTLFRERLVFARDTTVWFSVAGDYENFSAKEFGEILDDSAITSQVPFDSTSQITYLISTKSGLLIGSTDGEALISEGSSGQPFSPTNYKAVNTSSYGSRGVAPIKVDSAVLFVQKSGKKLREAQYDFNTDNIIAADVTLLAEHITGDGIIDMAFHKEPYSVLWCARADGVLLGFTYNKMQEVTGWHKHQLGGDGIVEAVQVIPRYNGIQDDLWLVVRRTINGTTKRYIEYMEADYTTGDAQEDCYYVDCGATYSGAATATISNLTWLESETVRVLNNGASEADKTVSGGVITLQSSTTKAQIGLPYTPILTTMKFEGGSQNGTSQGKTKRVSKIIVRLLNSLGVKVGSSGKYYSLDLRSPNTPMDTPNPLLTGDIISSPDSGYETDAQISITSDYAYPITLIAIMMDVNTHDR